MVKTLGTFCRIFYVRFLHGEIFGIHTWEITVFPDDEDVII